MYTIGGRLPVQHHPAFIDKNYSIGLQAQAPSCPSELCRSTVLVSFFLAGAFFPAHKQAHLGRGPWKILVNYVMSQTYVWLVRHRIRAHSQTGHLSALSRMQRTVQCCSMMQSSCLCSKTIMICNCPTIRVRYVIFGTESLYFTVIFKNPQTNSNMAPCKKVQDSWTFLRHIVNHDVVLLPCDYHRTNAHWMEGKSCST